MSRSRWLESYSQPNRMASPAETTAECYDGQNFFDTDHPVIAEDASSSGRASVPVQPMQLD